MSSWSLFIVKINSEGKKSIFIVYVNDIIITDDNLDEVRCLKKTIDAQFEVKELSDLKYYVGIERARSKSRIYVS